MVTAMAQSSVLRDPDEGSAPAIDVVGVSRRFAGRTALQDVSMTVERGTVHALLGPNGAGKTTLLRILAGLVQPNEGEVLIQGCIWDQLADRRTRRLFGLVPSGDRSFYLRISGLENLVFFARMQGLPRRRASERARECLQAVELEAAGGKPVGVYSHGMQKRLSFARALLVDPPVLLVDEATHDLDPQGARLIKDLAVERAQSGTAILWATQRVDEIRAFADHVTLLDRGRVRFAGTVARLATWAAPRTFVLRFANGHRDAGKVIASAREALAGLGTLEHSTDQEDDHYLLSLQDSVPLGRALATIDEAGIELLTCHEDDSPIERAFLRLTEAGR
jgi:ABC-2 type transport system ATP-binding protein